jgi:hypothetical protein
MRNAFLFAGAVLFGCADAQAVPPRVGPPRRDGLTYERDQPELSVPRLFEMLNAARAQRRLRPLQIDTVLCLAARQAAQRYPTFGRGAEQQLASAVNDDLARFSLVYRRVATSVTHLPSLALPEPALLPVSDPTMAYAGIAVEPDHERQDPSITIVVIVAE